MPVVYYWSRPNYRTQVTNTLSTLRPFTLIKMRYYRCLRSGQKEQRKRIACWLDQRNAFLVSTSKGVFHKTRLRESLSYFDMSGSFKREFCFNIMAYMKPLSNHGNLCSRTSLFWDRLTVELSLTMCQRMSFGQKQTPESKVHLVDFHMCHSCLWKRIQNQKKGNENHLSILALFPQSISQWNISYMAEFTHHLQLGIEHELDLKKEENGWLKNSLRYKRKIYIIYNK